MATTTASTVSLRVPKTAQAASTINFDWLFVLLSIFFAAGLYIDGWAHNHGEVDESFFTPWHGIFYAGFALVALALMFKIIQNRRAGYSQRAAIPNGYEYAVTGVLLFSFGGIGDLVWHTLFGIETNTEALLSPTHLMLVIGMVLIFTGPFRAAWIRQDDNHSWGQIFLAVISVLGFWSIITFITQFAHPMVRPWPAINVGGEEFGGEIHIMNTDGSGQTRLTTSVAAFDTHPAFSPDGDKIAFGSETTETGYEIFTMNLDGSNVEQLTRNENRNWLPAWSPDGTKIAYSTDSGENADIMVMNADGTNPITLTSTETDDWNPVWSPNGAQIAFSSTRDGETDIYLMNIDRAEVTNLTGDEFSGYHPNWAPDGSALAFTSNETGANHVYSLNLATGEITPITEGDHDNWSPAWSPDGSKIAYTSARNNINEIYVDNLDGSAPINVTNNPSMDSGFAQWSADGEKLVYRMRSSTDADNYFSTTKMLGAVNIILQAMLLVGASLLLIRRWPLPFGVFTLLFTLNALGMAFMDDEFRLIPAALLAGLIADWLYLRWGPSFDAPQKLRRFAFTVPFVFYSLYFATLFLTDTVTWTIHFWAGSIFIAGIAGWLVSYAMKPGDVVVSRQ